MKKLILIVMVASAMFACNSNPSDQIEGTWVAKNSKINNDTIFIEKIEGDRFNLRAHIWETGEKNAFSREVTFKENTIYLPNDKHFTFTENKEFIIDGELYKNID